MKAYGAQKVYCIKQETTSPEEVSSATDDLKKRLQDCRELVASRRTRVDDLSRTLRRYTVFEQETRKRSEILKLIAEIHRQIDYIETSRSETSQTKSDNTVKVSGDVLERQLSEVQSILDKRKRIVKRMIDEICEQSGMSRSELIGDLGLELSRGC